MDTDFGEEEMVENPTLKAAYNLAPLHHDEPLTWNYEVHLIGEKIYDKVIHLCEVCELPILVYGRMLPCKHVFCFDCARKCEKTCKRCNKGVQKVEKSALGTVYVCTHGAPKHSTKGCRRTYLSQRDLYSHVTHRHVSGGPSSEAKVQTTASTSSSLHATPVPQLPLTQQQAAQQQQATAILQPGSQPTMVSGSGLPQQQQVLSPAGHSIPGLVSMASAVPSHHQGASLIPGLGDLRPMSAATASPMVGQSSPLLASSSDSAASANHMSMSGMDLHHHPTPQVHPADQGVYRPLDSMPMSQHQHQPQQQAHLMGGGVMSNPGQGKPMMPRFGDPAVAHPIPVSSPAVQSINSQPMPPIVGGGGGAGGLHPSSMRLNAVQMHHHQQHLHHQQQHHHHMNQQQQHHHQHQQHMNMPYVSPSKLSTPAHTHMPTHAHHHPDIQKSHDDFETAPGGSGGGGQARTNVNLITVPIQDEGQYRPMPMVSQGQSMGGGANLTFGHLQSMPPGQNFGQTPILQGGINNATSAGFQHMGNQSMGVASPSPSNAAKGVVPFSPGTPPASANLRMNNPIMLNPRTAGMANNMQGALAEVVHALARANGGHGLMSIPGPAGGGGGQSSLNPRFNPSHWTVNNPRGPGARMNSNQHRPRGDGGQFKNNYFG